MLSLCLAVINTPVYYKLTKYWLYIYLPGKFVLITPTRAMKALQTLPLGPGSDLLVCSFHNNTMRFGLSVPDFFLVIEDNSKSLAVIARKVSEPLPTGVGGFGSREKGKCLRVLCRNKDVHFLLILLGPWPQWTHKSTL